MRIEDLPDAHLRIFARPPLPEPGSIEEVFLIAICGTGMGSLALLFKEAGYTVSGSDSAIYPPMSTRLQEAGIPIRNGFDPTHLIPPPDLIIVGNACTPTHPEAAYAREHNLVQQSFPEALSHFFIQDRASFVVAGTHGKTTTTGILIHLFKESGLQPGYLVGGVMKEDQTSAAIGQGNYFIVEGDEYDCAYFDKRPKFVHYRPSAGLVTSMELDHTDIYAGWDEYQEAFASFASSIPTHGALALCADHEPVQELAQVTSAEVLFYAIDHPAARVQARKVHTLPEGQQFALIIDEVVYDDFFLPLHGRHNLTNALGAIALSWREGISPDQIRTALSTFKGLARRQEVRAEINDILILDDFAHHPTAVRETIDAIRAGYPDRRLLAVFEPRSNSSRRKVFEQPYVEGFSRADMAFLSTPPFRHNDRIEDFMNMDLLLKKINEKGIPAYTAEGPEALLPMIQESVQPGDVILIMSNGGFGGIHDQLITALENQSF